MGSRRGRRRVAGKSYSSGGVRSNGWAVAAGRWRKRRSGLRRLICAEPAPSVIGAVSAVRRTTDASDEHASIAPWPSSAASALRVSTDRCRGRSPRRSRGRYPSGRPSRSRCSVLTLQPPQNQGKPLMRKLFQYGGIAASIILIAFGAGSLVTGIGGRAEVRDNLKREQIVGTPDMAKSVANKQVLTGAQAKAFAAGMRKHARRRPGLTYSQMGRYLTAAGKPTNDEKAAAIDPKTKQPVENGARNLWVTETALTTALNTAFFAGTSRPSRSSWPSPCC